MFDVSIKTNEMTIKALNKKLQDLNYNLCLERDKYSKKVACFQNEIFADYTNEDAYARSIINRELQIENGRLKSITWLSYFK